MMYTVISASRLHERMVGHNGLRSEPHWFAVQGVSIYNL